MTLCSSHHDDRDNICSRQLASRGQLRQTFIAKEPHGLAGDCQDAYHLLVVAASFSADWSASRAGAPRRGGLSLLPPRPNALSVTN